MGIFTKGNRIVMKHIINKTDLMWYHGCVWRFAHFIPYPPYSCYFNGEDGQMIIKLWILEYPIWKPNYTQTIKYKYVRAEGEVDHTNTTSIYLWPWPSKMGLMYLCFSFLHIHYSITSNQTMGWYTEWKGAGKKIWITESVSSFNMFQLGKNLIWSDPNETLVESDSTVPRFNRYI